MKISNDQTLSGEFLNNYFKIDKIVYFENKVTFDAIIQGSYTNWDEVKNHFKKDFRYFDDLLFKIHFKRNISLSDSERYNVLYFLMIGYYYSKDVRYFNEFLFFFREVKKLEELWDISRSFFFTNIIDYKHTHPLVTAQDVSNFVEQAKENNPLQKANEPVNIGLIGNPIFFKKIQSQLKKFGYNVGTYLVKYHRNKYLNALFNFPYFWRLLRFFRIIPSYTIVKHKEENISLHDKKSKGGITVGFHKLGFIIKNNILSQFSKGLLNDHWAVLPFVRGRSSIEYSVLFGFEVGSTIHLVTNKIDEGAIIGIYTYNTEDISSIKHLKRKIKNDLTNRAVRAITTYISSGYKTIENNPNMGLTYYSIHPILLRYIESDIMNKSV